MKIGDEVYVHGYVDEIRQSSRNDTIIIRNDGGYFGTIWSEIVYIVDTPQTESTGSPIGDYRDGAGAWQTDRMTEEEIDTMLAKVLVGQTDCPWK